MKNVQFSLPALAIVAAGSLALGGMGAVSLQGQLNPFGWFQPGASQSQPQGMGNLQNSVGQNSVTSNDSCAPLRLVVTSLQQAQNQANMALQDCEAEASAQAAMGWCLHLDSYQSRYICTADSTEESCAMVSGTLYATEAQCTAGIMPEQEEATSSAAPPEPEGGWCMRTLVAPIICYENRSSILPDCQVQSDGTYTWFRTQADCTAAILQRESEPGWCFSPDNMRRIFARTNENRNPPEPLDIGYCNSGMNKADCISEGPNRAWSASESDCEANMIGAVGYCLVSWPDESVVECRGPGYVESVRSECVKSDENTWYASEAECTEGLGRLMLPPAEL